MGLEDLEEQGDRDRAIGSRRRGGMGQVNNLEPSHDTICGARVCLIDFLVLSLIYALRMADPSIIALTKIIVFLIHFVTYAFLPSCHLSFCLLYYNFVL